MIQNLRTWIQSFFLVALHGSWGPEAKGFCNPVLSCHSCALAWFACPVGIFVHYSGYHLFPYLALGTVLLLGVLFGRILCGWVCPFGFLQDLLNRIPTPKLGLPAWTSYIKYLVLLSMVFVIPWFLGEETTYSFCRVCPASALEVTVPNLIMGGTVTVATLVKLGILVAVLGLALFTSRFFCRVLCPIGAIMAPMNFVSFWFVRPAESNCLLCSKCDKKCPVEGKPSERISAGRTANRALDCVVCHQCQTDCPSRRLDAKKREKALKAQSKTQS